MLYPLKFKPYLRTMIWGGNKIEGFKGLPQSAEPIGESWELSGYPGHESVVSNGEYAGNTLNGLIARFGEKLVGKKAYEKFGGEFPLLVKFIDAKEDLSIQVHPDDAMARREHGQKNGKTEMWYVIGSDPGACLYSGLSKAITPDEYEERIENHTITQVLSKYDVHGGDVFFLPAGRVHAIGSGTFLAEIQQSSDLTYRIYDYGRAGLDGKPRELHTALAKKAIDYSVKEDYRTVWEYEPDGESLLCDCPYFHTTLLSTDKEWNKDLRYTDSFLIAICVEGEGTLADAEPLHEQGPTKGHITTIRQGETVLIPASSLGVTFTPAEGRTLKVLLCNL